MKYKPVSVNQQIITTTLFIYIILLKNNTCKFYSFWPCQAARNFITWNWWRNVLKIVLS